MELLADLTILDAEDVAAIEALVAKLPADKLAALKEMPAIAAYLAEPVPVVKLSEQDRRLLLRVPNKNQIRM